jgi:hypothetical protein
MRPDHTRSISVSLLTTPPDASISIMSMSNARAPSATGRPSASNSRRCGKTLKRPNSIVTGVLAGPMMGDRRFSKWKTEQLISENFLISQKSSGRARDLPVNRAYFAGTRPGSDRPPSSNRVSLTGGQANEDDRFSGSCSIRARRQPGARGASLAP